VQGPQEVQGTPLRGPDFILPPDVFHCRGCSCAEQWCSSGSHGSHRPHQLSDHPICNQRGQRRRHRPSPGRQLHRAAFLEQVNIIGRCGRRLYRHQCSEAHHPRQLRPSLGSARVSRLQREHLRFHFRSDTSTRSAVYCEQSSHPMRNDWRGRRIQPEPVFVRDSLLLYDERATRGELQSTIPRPRDGHKCGVPTANLVRGVAHYF